MKGLAIALDMGSTNIQGFLVDVGRKKELAYANIPNSFARRGKDIVTRFAASFTRKDAARKIQESAVKDINRIMAILRREAPAGSGPVSVIAACGNTAMHHAALGLPFDTLLRAPFKPAHSRAMFTVGAREIGIDAESDKVKFEFLPNIDGFVGSDALCVILATGIHKKKGLQLAIDMGTNGEIIMGNSSRILVASASAGPAFEANGLHGSEIIDAVSYLLKKGAIDKSGFIKEGRSKTLRIGKKNVSISQEDVRKLQLAKAAISGGIMVLKDRFPKASFANVYITGLFGSRINKVNARHIGILPKEARKVTVIDRAALKGLKEVLCSRAGAGIFSGLLRKIEHVELHKESAFFPSFTEAILF